MPDPTLFALPDIIDNRTDDRRLSTILQRMLTQGSRLDIATAYFNVEGFALVREALEGVNGFRLLLGSEPKAANEIISQLRRDIELGLGHKATPEAVRAVVEFLKREDVTVRLFRNGFLHGKAYILQGVPMLGSVGIVGSSNFTHGGLTGNSELNAVERNQAAVE